MGDKGQSREGRTRQRATVDQITAEELADRIDGEGSFTLVDTRPAECFEGWHLPGATNVPYDPREDVGEATVGIRRIPRPTN